MKNYSSSIILSGWAVVYPDTSTPSPPLCLEVCVGGGIQGSAACDQNFARDTPLCGMECRGVSMDHWQHINPCTVPPTSGGIHNGTQRDNWRGVQTKFSKLLPPIFQVVNVVLLPPASD